MFLFRGLSLTGKRSSMKITENGNTKQIDLGTPSSTEEVLEDMYEAINKHGDRIMDFDRNAEKVVLFSLDALISQAEAIKVCLNRNHALPPRIRPTILFAISVALETIKDPADLKA